MEKYLGKKIRCPSCRGVFKLPADKKGASQPVRPPEGDPSADTLPAQAVPRQMREKKDRVPRATQPVKKKTPLALKIGAGFFALICLAGVGLTAVGIIFGGNPVEFTNTMAEQSGRVTDGWDRVKDEINTALNAGPAHAPAVETARQDALKEVVAVRKEMEEMKVPSMTLARELYDARLNYVKTVEELLKDDMPEMIDVLGDPAIDADTRTSRADSLYTPMSNTRENAVDRVLEVQKRYDQAHDLVASEP